MRANYRRLPPNRNVKMDIFSFFAVKHTQMDTIERVTPDALRRRYHSWKRCEEENIAMDREFGYKTRRNGLQEHVSENIIKFILRNHLAINATWECTVGDLFSNDEGITECKSFTSDGPTSFGPKQKWDVIYFLDARRWLEDEFILYKVALSSTDPIWINMPVSKTQTKADQADENRRPRANWKLLSDYLGENCKVVYRGSFEGIFTPRASAPTGLQSV